MSDEAVKLALKIKDLDRKIVQFKANDQLRIDQGEVPGETFFPLAPRYEKERLKALERLRTLEGREGKGGSSVVSGPGPRR
jgi:hypothetical protein